MNKFILIPLTLISLSAIAATEKRNVMYEDIIDSRAYVARKSHWETTFGLEGMKYDLPFNFPGAKKTINPGDKELWGGRLGLGRQFYLGKGFTTTTKGEAYYMGTLFVRNLNAGPEASDDNVKEFKQTGQILGLDFTQSIGHIFEMKTKGPLGDWHNMTIEPYIEAGAGMARAFNKVNYSYNLTPNEAYKQSVEDQLVNVRFGLGVNVASSQGVFFFAKVTQNHYDITQRKLKTSINNASSTKETQKNVNIDPVLIYALGGGYRF